jgi:hypothetical protein
MIYTVSTRIASISAPKDYVTFPSMGATESGLVQPASVAEAEEALIVQWAVSAFFLPTPMCLGKQRITKFIRFGWNRVCLRTTMIAAPNSSNRYIVDLRVTYFQTN